MSSTPHRQHPEPTSLFTSTPDPLRQPIHSSLDVLHIEPPPAPAIELPVPVAIACLPQLLLLGESPLFDTLLTRALHPRCARASSTAEAEKLLRALPFRLILAIQDLPGYSPYSLLPHLAGHPLNFYIALELRHSTVWLPALLDGQRALGLPPLDSRAILAHLHTFPSLASH